MKATRSRSFAASRTKKWSYLVGGGRGGGGEEELRSREEFPDPGIEARSPALQADSLPSEQ